MSVKLAKSALVSAGLLFTLYALEGRAMQPRVNEQAVASSASKSPFVKRLRIKYRAGSVELRDVSAVNRGIAAAALRSGISRPVAATASAPGRPAVSATVLRRSAVPGWTLVSTSAPINAQELAAFTREMKANPAVEYVEEERILTAAVEARSAAPVQPTDPDYARYQWNFSDPASGVHAPQAWAYSQGEGVVVAVVDTGIVQDHPDLKGNVLPGYDMISSHYFSRRSTDGRVAGGWDVGSWEEKDYCLDGITEGRPVAKPSSWHGTHVAGTIAQETNNGTGLAGLAYKAKVLPIRVLGSCGGSEIDILEGALWAAGGEVPGLPKNPNPADVINMSLGGRGSCPSFMQEAIDQINRLGTIIVVAAGNLDDRVSAYSPASCNGVIAVGATDELGGKAIYSNYGPRIDISAPGGNATGWPLPDRVRGIWQMINGGERGPLPGSWPVAGYSGTSMASPHVAAAVAMVQSVAKQPLTFSQLRDLLQQTASPLALPIVGGRTIGAGILNVEEALSKVINPPCYPNCGLVATTLNNKVSTAVSGAAGQERLYRFEAKAGSVLTIMTYGGKGDISLYASFNREPGVDAAEARSTAPGTTETLRFPVAKSGTYFIKVRGVTAFTNVSVVARQ
ncbi:S8 family peptidase [Stenotrophomonas sp.]|uniref:S8 family peptidase n=1 Tax=Stenotrophomonas sp. TaxID=69392 RepID=UPI0028A9F73E|nr:S8 family peptidase [Stenotrophomonas sp.]